MPEITRRRLLATAGTAAAGALAAGVALRPSAEAGATQLHAHHHAHAAAAPNGWETVARDVHRGRLIEVETNGKAWRCRIDRKPLHPHVFDRQADRRFSSHLLPYEDPADPLRLARALIDGEVHELFRLH
jgi:hypothetical protein